MYHIVTQCQVSYIQASLHDLLQSLFSPCSGQDRAAAATVSDSSEHESFHYHYVTPFHFLVAVFAFFCDLDLATIS